MRFCSPAYLVPKRLQLSQHVFVGCRCVCGLGDGLQLLLVGLTIGRGQGTQPGDLLRVLPSDVSCLERVATQIVEPLRIGISLIDELEAPVDDGHAIDRAGAACPVTSPPLPRRTLLGICGPRL